MGKSKLITAAEVAEILGWDQISAARWMREQGIAIVVGRRVYTSKEKLLAAYPDIYQEILNGESDS